MLVLRDGSSWNGMRSMQQRTGARHHNHGRWTRGLSGKMPRGMWQDQVPNVLRPGHDLPGLMNSLGYRDNPDPALLVELGIRHASMLDNARED